MFSSVIYLVFLAFSTLLFQIIGLGVLFLVSDKKQIDENSWAWGRIIGWLSMGLIIWFISHFIGINNNLGFWLTFLLLNGLLFFSKFSVTSQVKLFLRKHRKIIFLQELIFISGFVFLGIVRMYNPHVLDLEKFMDGGLMQKYLVSSSLPIEDMWLAGEKVNYYTFGHFLGSLMIRFWHVPMEFGYNFLLAFILGLMAIESFSLGRIFLKPFLKKKKNLLLIVVGLVTMLLVNFGGNSHPIWYFVKNGSFDKYWYPDATRFIERTIHEFPAYSYIVSDLHAHVWGMPLVLLMLFFSWRWMNEIVQSKIIKDFSFKKIVKNQWFKESIFLGLILGVLAMTSTWDMMIYGLFLGVLGLFLLFISFKKFWSFIISGSVAVVAAAVAVSLWLLNFTSISQGVFFVYENSPLWQLPVLWGGHFGLSFISILLAKIFFGNNKKTHHFWFLLSLGMTAFVLLIIPEVIYFKDIYPNHPRANTMFKFTFQAFIMMSFLASWGLGFLLQSYKDIGINRFVKYLTTTLFLSIFIGFLSYPFLGYPSYYGSFKENKGWNGLTWMKKGYLADYQAVVWLREQSLDGVILEAVGESYTKKARVSTFTGMTTVLGWRVHEWLWRGGFEIPGQRTTEVQTIYEDPLSFEAQESLSLYKVEYIFIGSQENKVYELAINDLLKLGDIIYSQDGVFIIKVREN
jgi:uncharacterized membrane protein